MAPTPFRRRKAAKTARNLAIAEAALALAKDRFTGGSRHTRRGPGKVKGILLAGAAVAAGAVAVLKRDKVTELLPSRSSEPAAPFTPVPPQPSNYDAPGPVANTATPIPAPDPHGVPPAKIDEQAEEAAAAAEAAAIGGQPSEYAGPELGEPAGEAFRPLAEAGEGESEGQEQAEAELADNATYRDAGMSDSERQIDDAIEQAGQPQVGETPEPLVSDEPRPSAAGTDAGPASSSEPFLPPEPPAPPATDETGPDTPGGGISGRPFAGLENPPAEGEAPRPGAEPEAQAQAQAEEKGKGDDPDEWRTWSGRAVEP